MTRRFPLTYWRTSRQSRCRPLMSLDKQQNQLPSLQQQQHDQQAEEELSFRGSSKPDLLAWLAQTGIDTSCYGTGASKSVDLLWEEVQEGETVLTVCDGRPLRFVSVVNVIISNNRGQTLVESQQVLPSGTVRPRNKPLSEKLLPGERWQDGVVRGVVEELGSVLPRKPEVTLDENSYEEVVEEKESQSYPGLYSKYVCHRVQAKVVGLPEDNFTTQEERGDGQLTHVWEWQ